MSVADLFDKIIHDNHLKNDARLSAALKVAPPVISKMRANKLPFGDNMTLRIHRKFGIPVAEIDKMVADDKQ